MVQKTKRIFVSSIASVLLLLTIGCLRQTNTVPVADKELMFGQLFEDCIEDANMFIEIRPVLTSKPQFTMNEIENYWVVNKSKDSIAVLATDQSDIYFFGYYE